MSDKPTMTNTIWTVRCRMKLHASYVPGPAQQVPAGREPRVGHPSVMRCAHGWCDISDGTYFPAATVRGEEELRQGKHPEILASPCPNWLRFIYADASPCPQEDSEVAMCIELPEGVSSIDQLIVIPRKQADIPRKNPGRFPFQRRLHLLPLSGRQLPVPIPRVLFDPAGKNSLNMGRWLPCELHKRLQH